MRAFTSRLAATLIVLFTATSSLPACRRHGAHPAGGHGAVQVAVGEHHACALLRDGSVWCWGRNRYGQLGTGDLSYHPSPVRVPGVAGARSISLARNQSCALLRDGTVTCWGGFDPMANVPREGTPGAVPPARIVPDVRNAVTLESSVERTCARLRDGGGRCWGVLLRDANPFADPAPDLGPDNDPPMPGAVQVTGSGAHRCARMANGAIACWGENRSGECGQPPPRRVDSPTIVPGISGAVELASVGGWNCARTRDGGVSCWGMVDEDNPEGWRPWRVAGLPAAVAIFLGPRGRACARTRDGGVWCWGAWTDGHLAFQQTELRGATSLALGEEFTCAVRGGEVYCTGSNEYGQLGTGRSVLTHVATDAPAWGRVGRFAAGGAFTCALGDDGAVRCAGLDRRMASDVVTEVPELRGVRDLWAGANHVCGFAPDGEVRCAGNNSRLQLGTASEDAHIATVSGLRARSLALTADRSCALREDGAVACWGNLPPRANGVFTGDNMGGFLVPPAPRTTATPEPEPAVADVVALAAGQTDQDHFTCALRGDGTVWCWGANLSGQLGDDTSGMPRATPAPVRGLTEARKLACGTRHCCAVRGDGSVWCWGSDRYGQLGAGERVGGDSFAHPAPVRALGIDDATDVATGDDVSCALRRGDGRVWCWGTNARGETGDGTEVAWRSVPAPVAGLSSATQVACGGAHCCAVRADHTAACWGVLDFAGFPSPVVPSGLVARVAW